jgi:hypothetical protein
MAFRAITMRNVILWNVTPSYFVDMYLLRGICRLHFQDVIQFKAETILKLKADDVHYLEVGDITTRLHGVIHHNYHNDKRYTILKLETVGFSEMP